MLTRPTAWNSPLGQISAEMDRLFDSVLPALSVLTPVANRTPFPPLNVWETDEGVVIEAEIPGVPRDQLHLTVQGQELTIRGQRAIRQGEGMVRQERWRGEFERTLPLPASIDPETVKATLSDGVLTVTLMKRAESRPRRIEVGSLPSGS